MFITIGNRTQYVSEFTGKMMLSNPEAREATVKEAAECINRLILDGDGRMHLANDYFKAKYHKPIIKNPATLSLIVGNGK